MLGRMAMSWALRVLPPLRHLRGCLTAAFIGVALLLATHRPMLAALGVFLLGLGFSATFPTILGFVADRYAMLSGTAFGIVMVMALTGGTTLPFVTGLVGASYGLRTALLIVPAALFSLLILLTAAPSRVHATGNVDVDEIPSSPPTVRNA